MPATDGNTVDRSVDNSAAVAASCGPEVGTTPTISNAPSLLGRSSPTRATPPVRGQRGGQVRAPIRWASPAGTDWTSTTTVNGPFAPGPKPSEIASKACRSV